MPLMAMVFLSMLRVFEENTFTFRRRSLFFREPNPEQEQAMTESNLDTITGTVRTITFHNEDNGFIVAKIEPDNGIDKKYYSRDPNHGRFRKSQAAIPTVAVKGFARLLTEGESVELCGYWTDDPKWGMTFRFDSYKSVLPSTADGIERFLASKHIKGIGPKYAKSIVSRFGRDTIRVLDEEPDRLREVPGLPRAKIKAVKEGWQAHRHIRDVMIFLQSYDISAAYALRIYEKYRNETIDRMRRNPYQLIRDIRGIGFLTADRVAMKLGVEKDSPDRIRAGVLHVMTELADRGNIFSNITPLVESAAETLDVDAAAVQEQIEHLLKTGLLKRDGDRVYDTVLYDYESEIARRLRAIAESKRTAKPMGFGELSRLIADVEQERGVTFADMQRNAIIQAATSNLMVLTGGPGTGKTTTVLGIIDIFRHLKMSVLLCAPTGRAAKRMSEATGMESKTIHRLLEYNPATGKFARNEGDPLGAHAVIMDEASMVDTALMAEFLRAVSPYTTLVIVGDVDQLPSIGPGSVLRDIITSEMMPTIRLTEIFRQAAQSRIVQCAHMINDGRLPYTDNDHAGNFFFIRETDPAKVAETIAEMAARRLPMRYGFDPVDDIQVLSPMHKSETGVERLNQLLQERLNPPGPRVRELKHGGWTFREGDKVMQVRNNYDKLVYNGDIGRIARIDTGEGEVVVRFDITVSYKGSELDELVPAYAVSVHKSQGSEFRCVIMPVTTQHFIMLKRNLIYTAVTRARELAVLIGDHKALAIAVKNDQARERATSLEERLRFP